VRASFDHNQASPFDEFGRALSRCPNWNNTVIVVYFSTKTEKWRGMLVCTEQQYHASLMRDFPGLVPHSRLANGFSLPKPVTKNLNK
jgi:hypothetical protein